MLTPIRYFVPRDYPIFNYRKINLHVWYMLNTSPEDRRERYLCNLWGKFVSRMHPIKNRATH